MMAGRVRRTPNPVIGITLILLLGGISVVLLAPRPDTDDLPTRGQQPLLQIVAEPDTVPQSGRMIRVNLTADQTAAIHLQIDADWTIRLPGSSTILDRGNRLARTTVRPGRVGIRIGDQEYPASRLEIDCGSTPAIWINQHQYRGRVQLHRLSERRLMAINVVDIEQYVASVIDSEMPAEFGTEARMTQAVVARTYALYQQATYGRTHRFDLYASTRSQKYLGFQYLSDTGRRLAGESVESRRLARASRGIVCLDRDGIFCTYYSAACGGLTSHGRDFFNDASAVLQSQPCDWCREASLFRWKRTVSRERLQSRLANYASSRKVALGNLQRIEQLSRFPEATRTSVRFHGSSGDLTLDGSAIRTRILAGELPSPHFRMQYEEDSVLVEGRGHGHGVGLCQWGARGQSRSGHSWQQILAHYYPGMRLVRLDLSK